MKRLLLQLVVLATLGFCFGALALRATGVLRGDPLLADAPPGSVGAALNDANEALAPFAHPPASQFAETLARPVFFSTRAFPSREPKKAAAPGQAGDGEGAPAGKVDNLKLWGVLIDASTRKALLGGPSGEARWLSPGERIEQWVVKEIAEERVTLISSGREATLTLYKTLYKKKSKL